MCFSHSINIVCYRVTFETVPSQGAEAATEHAHGQAYRVRSGRNLGVFDRDVSSTFPSRGRGRGGRQEERKGEEYSGEFPFSVPGVSYGREWKHQLHAFRAVKPRQHFELRLRRDRFGDLGWKFCN